MQILTVRATMQVTAAFKQSFEIAANSFIAQIGHALQGRKMLEETVESL